MLEIGSKFGDYTVIELLGKGAMGEVYKISDGSKDYALKIMSAKSDDVQKVHEWRKRFAREAEVAMKVRHRSLIEVYDIGEDPETHLCYILMEYVGGGTLTDRLKAKGKLEIREAVTITMHVANALSAAHAIGIVHRDIKPDNIMFTSDGVPKLADLGIARWTGSDGETTVTKTEMIIGTPAYMSPEQMLNSHNVDARADIYSLGIVFYEMLTGLRPNQGSTIVQLMARAIKGEELPDVRELRPEVSATLAYALSRMVAHKAELRPQSAAEAAQLVYDAATGKMAARVGAGRGTCAESQIRRKGRNRVVWCLVAFLGVAAAVAAFVGAFLLRPDRAPQPSVETTRVHEVVVTNVVNVVNAMDANMPADVHSAAANGYRWLYRLEKDHAVLCANGRNPCLEPKPKGKVVVPKELDGRNVIALDRRAFADCDELTEIVLPEGLTEIRGERTFVDCRRLEYVRIPATLRFMGFHTFQNCTKLRRIDLVNCIGVPPGKEEYSGAMGGCFLNCSNLEAIDVSPSNPAFVSIDGALYSRSRKELFVYPKTRADLTLPGEVSTIGSSAFSTCLGLRRIKLPESVQTIRPWAFECCDNLEELALPGRLKRIGQKTLVKDKNLKRVIFLGDAPAFESPLFTLAPEELILEVARGSKGWNGSGSTDLPERWPVGAGNDSRTICYIGDAKKSSSAALPAVTDMVKTTDIFPRLDRNKKAWAYSFEHLDGWEKPDFDDGKWKCAPGGFGYRVYQSDIRCAAINTEWKTSNIYLRRHFNWDGGDVSRAVLEFFIDDHINVYLNGRPIYYKRGNWIYWEMGEIDPRIFNNALKKGDNVLCVEAENTRAASYVDCGLRVETGGVVKEKLGDGERKVQTAAGTWTLLIRNGLVFLGDGRDKALDPEPMGELEIPAELGGLRITELNQNSFRGCGLLKKVTVHEGVRSIRQHAFRDCHALESISLPDSLEWIVHNAFHQTKLKSLNIKNTRLLCSEALDQCALEQITANPGNPTYFVKDGVLYDRVRRAVVKCPVSCTDYRFPKGIEAIYSEAFQWSKIKSVVIPRSAKLVGSAAFHECSSLESVEFKGDDAIINGAAFSGCTNLKKIVLPKKLKFFDDALAFQNCRKLEEVEMPDTVERIYNGTFLSCHGLKRVKIGKHVSFMGQRVFRNCYSIETITLPATLTHMGERMFLDCRSLQSVFFEGDAPQVVEERPFEGANADLVVYVKKGARGWTDASGNLLAKWPVGDPDARPVRYVK